MRIAVLGLGFMGSTHLKALRNVSGATVAAVVSADDKKLSGDLSDIQGNLGGPGEKMDFSGVARYHTVEEALHDPHVDAVDICLPTDRHTPVAIDALRAGKHVLVEKPMALDGESADRMIAEAERSGKLLMTAQVLRFLPSYAMTAEILKSAKLGAVRSAIFRRRCAAPAWTKWLSDPSLSGGGVFDLLIHDVDYCIQLFGSPEAVSAAGYEDMPRGIDVIVARFHYPGVDIVVTGGWHHPKAYPFSAEFTIIADGGTLEYHTASRPLTLYDAGGVETSVALAEKDGFEAELEYFVACATSGSKPVRCPPEESAMAVRVALKMLESRSRNGERIECKL
jgi:1,5-anhydro-D-fructose reductase (1,5-anhydro-D-mannitol-forming)